MKRYFGLTLGLAVVLAGVAISQDAQQTSAPKPKPAAGRVSSTDTPATPARTTTAAPPEMAAPQPAAVQPVATQQPMAPAREASDLVINRRTETTAPMDALLLPTGTTLRMRLQKTVSTSTSKEGDSFTGSLTEPVMLDGKTMIPVGASVQGRIAHLSEPRRFRGLPVIHLTPESLTMPSGENYNISAVVVDTSDPRHHNVDTEGRIKGEGHNGVDLRNLIVGAGVGSVIGAVVETTAKATLIGGGIGASAMMVHWLIKRRSEQLPAGTELFLELSRPVSMNMASAATGR